MNAFPKTHLWMLAPFLIAIAGFYFTYWSRFTEVPFHQHLHGLTATAWFVLLMVQPWLQKQRRIELHRSLGLVGLFVAGGVVFSALQVVSNNMVNDRLSPVLRYGLTWGDFLFLTGFSHAVLMAMHYRRQMALHARYMIASAVWAILPALARLIYFPLLVAFGSPPILSFVHVVYLSVALTLAVLGIMVAVDYRRERKVYSSYVAVAGGVLLFGLTLRPMGEASWWIAFCDGWLR